MNKDKFWGQAWMIGFLVWFVTLVGWLLSITMGTDQNPHPHPSVLAIVGLILWFVVPIFWAICSGFILTDMYGWHLGWRNQRYGPNKEYVREVDTTPAKRITLQWLAPFAMVYFLLSGKEKHKVEYIP